MSLSVAAFSVEPATPPLPLLVSSVIPGEFRHGFTIRAGGVSAPPFDTLNLGMRWGDQPANVVENRRRVVCASAAVGFHCASQVHGTVVHHVRANDEVAATARCQADGLCADTPGLAVAVYVADCVPLLMADPRTGAFAAVHAGWRGAAAGVTAAALRALVADFGVRPADVKVAMGPAIGVCCFEVGPEVVAAFDGVLPDTRRTGVVVERPGRRPHIDIKRACQLTLQAEGVPAGAIDAGPECTRCDPGRRFFSYRRDGGRTGQHLGFIGRLRAPTSPSARGRGDRD